MAGLSAVSALLTIAAAYIGAVDSVTSPRSTCDPSLANGTLFDFSVQNVYENASIDLSALRGKVTLIVNVATY